MSSLAVALGVGALVVLAELGLLWRDTRRRRRLRAQLPPVSRPTLRRLFDQDAEP